MTNYSKPNILITGSVGFIGRHLMKAFLDAFSLDIKDSKDQDINDLSGLEDFFQAFKPDVVIHLAAISTLNDVNKDKRQAITTNIIGTLNVLELCKKYQVEKIIYVSSAARYEPESSIYAMTKEFAELLCKEFKNVYVLRLFNVYGKGSKSVVNRFIQKIKMGKSIEKYGDTVRDYVYIDDVIETFKEIIYGEWIPMTMEVASGKGTSLKELVGIISSVLKKEAKTAQRPKKKEIQYSVGKKSLFYRTSLEKGIKKM